MPPGTVGGATGGTDVGVSFTPVRKATKSETDLWIMSILSISSLVYGYRHHHPLWSTI